MGPNYFSPALCRPSTRARLAASNCAAKLRGMGVNVPFELGGNGALTAHEILLKKSRLAVTEPPSPPLPRPGTIARRRRPTYMEGGPHRRASGQPVRPARGETPGNPTAISVPGLGPIARSAMLAFHCGVTAWLRSRVKLVQARATKARAYAAIRGVRSWSGVAVDKRWRGTCRTRFIAARCLPPRPDQAFETIGS